MIVDVIARWSALSCVVACVSVWNPAAMGEGCPVEVREVGRWDNAPGNYADIWAEGNNAYVGRWNPFGDSAAIVQFIDVSNPATPNRFLEWQVGPPNEFASAQDVKTGDGMLFISLESDGNDGVEIVDIRDPQNPAHLSWVTVPGMSAVHGTFYDSGFLYIVNSATPQISVVDLTNFDLDNPPVRIQTARWTLQAGNAFVHDITVVNGRLYACAWDSGLHVYDVTNVANAPPVFLGSGAGNSTHAVWATDDGRWAVVGEERGGGPIKLYEIVPNGNSVDVVLRDTFALPSSEANSAHNPTIVGLRVYVTWYQAGLRIFDIDEAQGLLIDQGGFDTFSGGPNGFDGAWGIYPFLGEDRILVSDMASGLFVFDTQSLVSLSYPNGLVTEVHPVDGATLTVEIGTDCGDPDPSTAKVVVSIGSEGGTVDVPLTPLGGDMFEAQLPGAPCGSAYSYYVTIDTLGGETVVDPPGAPDAIFSAEVLTAVVQLMFDDFEQPSGWMTDGEICPGEGEGTGAWERVDPIGTASAPENDFGDGTMCFVTEQGSLGGSNGEADVDGGPFALTSRPIVIGGQSATVSYARWFVSNDDDVLLVEISGDAGASWSTVEEITSTGTVWVVHQFEVSDIVPLSNAIELRFTVGDCPNNSITEAAIDDVSVVIIECVDDDASPFIVHDGGVTTHPYSGYIDPRRDSDNGVDLNQGIDTLTVTFNEPVRNVGGADLDASAFTVLSTGAAAPTVDSVEASANPEVVLTLSGPLLPGSWYTVVANVEDTNANPIVSEGDLGPGVNEADRVDIAFLPADVDQDGEVGPFDLLAFRQLVNELQVPTEGTVADFADTDRNGEVGPFDLLSFRQLVNGVTPATQAWSGAMLDAPRP